MNQQSAVSVSIVSHGQGSLVAHLLHDIRSHCVATPLHVLLTLNIEEHLPFDIADFPFEIRIIRNQGRRGFAANHNAAFALACGEYFCVLNPDVRFDINPFPALTAGLSDASVGVAGPLVLAPDGQIEDSARHFPTPFSIARKLFGSPHDPDYSIAQIPVHPDWIAGMFMLWRTDVFRQLTGFDEGFFLYYEDVDICVRLYRSGLRVVLIPSVRVTHYAQRASRRNVRYLRWHLTSMFRYFWRQIVG